MHHFYIDFEATLNSTNGRISQSIVPPFSFGGSSRDHNPRPALISTTSLRFSDVRVFQQLSNAPLLRPDRRQYRRNTTSVSLRSGAIQECGTSVRRHWPAQAQRPESLPQVDAVGRSVSGARYRV